MKNAAKGDTWYELQTYWGTKTSNAICAWFQVCWYEAVREPCHSIPIEWSNMMCVMRDLVVLTEVHSNARFLRCAQVFFVWTCFFMNMDSFIGVWLSQQGCHLRILFVCNLLSWDMFMARPQSAVLFIQPASWHFCPSLISAGLRTELKHIIKSRKRKQQQFP